MAAFMHRRIVDSYRPTLIAGGEFESVTRPVYQRDADGNLVLIPNPDYRAGMTPDKKLIPAKVLVEAQPQKGIIGIPSILGTTDVTTSNPQMSTLEGFFPELGQEIRRDPAVTNGRFARAAVADGGKITALAVDDPEGCANDALYIGGNFQGIADKVPSGIPNIGGTTIHKETIADLAKINLNPGVVADWTMDTKFRANSVSSTPEDNTNTYISSMALDGDKIYASGSFGAAGQAPRAGFATYLTDEAGTAKTDGHMLRDGADDIVQTISVNRDRVAGSVRAFVGGDFKAYDGVAAKAGLAAMKEESKDPYAIVNVTGFRPKVRVPGTDITSMAATDGQLFVAGNLPAGASGPAHGYVASYDRDESSDNLGAMLNGAKYAVTGEGSVDALVAKDDRVFVGGSFATYTTPSGQSCQAQPAPGHARCNNLVALDRTGELFGGAGAGYGYPTLYTDGPVKALALGNERLYVGGAFDTAGGYFEHRGGLLVVHDLDGTTDLTFHGAPNGTDGVVNALALAGKALFIAGEFHAYRGTAVPNIAKIGPTGLLDGQFHDSEFGTPGTDGPITSLQLIGNQLFAIGDFTHVGEEARPGIAALDGNAGAIVESFRPDPQGGSITSLGSVGDRLLVGGTFTGIDGREGHGNIGIRVDVDDDKTPPHMVVSQSVGEGGAGYFTKDGLIYVSRDALPTADKPTDIKVSIETYDRATFSQYENATGPSTLAGINWPTPDDMLRLPGAETIPPHGINAECWAGQGDRALDAPQYAAGVDVINGNSAFPSTMADLVGKAECRWTSNLLVPTNAGDTLHLRISGHGGARAWLGTGPTPGAAKFDSYDASGSMVRETFDVPTAGLELLPFTLDWAGTVPNGDLKLEWQDTNELWHVIPRAAFAAKTTFNATYRLTKPITGETKFDFTSTDFTSTTTAQVVLKMDTTPPDGADTFASAVALPENNVIDGSNFTIDIGTDKGDDLSGSGTRRLERQFHEFDDTTGECAAADPDGVWDDLGIRVSSANTYDPTAGGTTMSQGCYTYRLVTEDNVGNKQFQYIGLSKPIVVDSGAPSVTVTNPGAVLEGSTATLSGTLEDTGVGVDTYMVKIVEGDYALPNCSVTVFAWTCTIDTSQTGDGEYTLKVWAKDRVGHESSDITDMVDTVKFRVDNVGPDVDALGIDLGVPAGTASSAAVDADGAMPTVWFNPNQNGSFTVATKVTDDGSGLTAPTFSSPGAGWRVTAGAAAAGRGMARSLAFAKPGAPVAVAQTFAWDAPDAVEPGQVDFTATELLGKASTKSMNVRSDGAFPTIDVGEAEVSDKGVITVPITIEETGSGLANAGFARRVGAMSIPGTCDKGVDWSDLSTVTTLPINATSITDTDTQSGRCYRYSITAIDRVGNQRDLGFDSARIRVGDIAAVVPKDEIEHLEATPPVPVTPAPVVTPPKLRDKPIDDKPAATAPVLKPVVVTPATQVPSKPVAPRPLVVRESEPVTARPKRYVAATKPIPVVQERRAASTPKRVAAKHDDRSWLDKSIGWTKHHKLEAAAAGLAGAHLGGTLLFGKGLGGLLSHFHLNVPFGVVRRVGRRFWQHLGRTRDDEDDDGDDPWSDVPAPYRAAA
jgi:hypothetical protein